MAERLERYASANQPEKPTTKGERPTIGGLIQSSAAMANLNKVVERRDWGANMARELARADLVLKPTEFVALRIGFILGIPAIVFLLGMTILPALANPFALIVGVVAGWWTPRFWLHWRQGGASRPSTAAWPTRSCSSPTPFVREHRSCRPSRWSSARRSPRSRPSSDASSARCNLGLPFEQALANMVRRVRSEDLELMTTAITIQHQVGGNLAEILDSIAFTIRERIRIKGEIKTLTAQQRMSGYVVGFLPIGLVGILMVIAPKFMDPMFQKPPDAFGLPLGLIILGIGGLMMLLGFFFIRRIVDIEV